MTGYKPTTADAYELFHEGMITLSEMEHNGIRIDKGYIESSIVKSERVIKDIEEEMREQQEYKIWRQRFGGETNLGSREQLAAVLFDDELPYEAKEYTTGGATGKGKRRAKVDEEALKDIKLRLVELYLEVEGLKKTVGTYFFGALREAVEMDKMWFVRPSYSLNIAATYRSQCEKPNFQNIPIRDPEMAQLIRPCYIPRPGQQIIESDFSGIEVKVAYCYHKDPKMQQYLCDPTTDMHRDMAMQIFCLTKEHIAKDPGYAKRTVRDSAKNQFVFPQFYGSVYFNCAPKIWDRLIRDKFKLPGTDTTIREHLAACGITELGDCDLTTIKRDGLKKGTFVHHLYEIERDFWEVRFPVFTAWKKKAYQAYQQLGYVDTYTGFRCYGPLAKNQVTNYYIQGPAFHCLLWVLNKYRKFLRKYKMKTMLIGTIHDCKLTDTDPKERDACLSYSHELMTKELPKAWPWMIAPLEVESDVTPIDSNWHMKKTWVEKNGLWQPKDTDGWLKSFGAWQ